jgi:hypothetical protein
MKKISLPILVLASVALLASCNVGGSSSIASVSSEEAASSSSSAEEQSSSSSAEEQSSSSSSSADDKYVTSWTLDDIDKMEAAIGITLPVPTGLTKTYTCTATTSLAGQAGVSIVDPGAGDITSSYEAQLAADGFIYAPDRSGNDYGYQMDLFDKPIEGETNTRRVISVQVDYYPGSPSGETPEQFEISANIYVYPLVETSSTWDTDFIKTALQSDDAGALIPAYTSATNTLTYTFKDYHEWMEMGYAVVDITGSDVTDATAYIDTTCVNAGLTGGDSADFTGSKEYTGVADENYTCYMQIENYLAEKTPFIRLEIMTF